MLRYIQEQQILKYFQAVRNGRKRGTVMKNYSIGEMVESGERNKNKAHCLFCERELLAGEGYRVFIPSRGKRVVCSEHYNTNGLLMYHGNKVEREGTNNIIGSDKKLPLTKTTVGIEIETVTNDFNCDANSNEYTSLRMMLQSAFLVKAEADGSVDAEFPTEKMMGLATISKVLQSMDKHGLIKYVNHADCGAHVHVYCNDIPYIRRYYHSIFLPLYHYIDSMETNRRIEYFGSDWRYYACRIGANTSPVDHCNFINAQHDKTLEFRLPRITGHKQYMNVIKFWRLVGYTINSYNLHKDGNRTERKASADALASELVEIARKYFPY